ncbi:DDE superfamily endonuclease, partial [Phytophthora infestans]
RSPPTHKSPAVSQEDAVILLLFTTVQPERLSVPAVRLYLTVLNDADSELLFRFSVEGVLSLTAVSLCRNTSSLEIVTKCFHGSCVHFIVSFKLPKEVVQHDEGQLSRIIRIWLSYTFNAVCAERIQRYAEAVRGKGAPMEPVLGFIDGAKNSVCRPSSRPECNESLQRQRVHSLNYQAVVTPDGLAIHFWNPIEDRRHDITLLYASKFVEYLETNRAIFGGYTRYGDPVYGVRNFIVSDFKKAGLSSNE